MFPLILSPIGGLLIFWAMRGRNKLALWYSALVTLTFVPTIPIFLTYLKYSSTILRDSLVTIFFSFAIAALIQKGSIQRVITISLLLIVFFKGPLFGIYFPPTFDISTKVDIKHFDFENYSVTLQKTKQQTVPDIYHWKGKKYFFGKMLYAGLHIADSSAIHEKCLQKLFISRVDNYEKGTISLERIVSYDTCQNKISSIARHNR